MARLNMFHSLRSHEAAKTRSWSDPNQSSAATEFQVGDLVGFEDDAKNFPLAIGTILLIKPADQESGTDECIVVQVGPNVLGIYRVEQLVRFGYEELRSDVDWNGCATTV
jgi:hypothetical protein